MSDDQQSDGSSMLPNGTVRQLIATAWALTWRSAVAVVVSGLIAMVLVALVLGVAGSLAGPGTAGSPAIALGLALVPLIGLLLATAAGLTVGVSAVALLVRNQLDHSARQRQSGPAPQTSRRQHLQLRGSLRTAVRSAPAAVIAGLATAGLVIALVLAAPLAALTAAAVAGWRAVRSPGQRKRALRTLRWAVPFAPAAAAAAAAPAVYASIINRTSLRTAVATARRQGLRARAVTLAGLTAVIAIGWSLTHLTLGGSVVGGTRYDAALVFSMLLAGVALGVLAHAPTWQTHRGTDSDTPGGSGVASPSETKVGRRGPRGWAVPARLARVASMTALAIVASSVSAGAVVLPVSAAQAATAIVVDTDADASTIVDPDQCRTEGAPCGIRAAVAYAGEQAATQGIVPVTFAEDTSVQLAGTLLVPAGVTLDGVGHNVTLDAHHAFRAIETYLIGGEGAQVRLRNLRVTGGRSTPGGAGLYTNSAGVTLFQTTWEDNVSGGAGDGTGDQPNGGAVAAPYTTLTVTNSTFDDNHASDGVGGAVAANRLTMTNSTIVNSTGGPGRPEGGAVYAEFGGHVSHVTVTDGGGISGSESTNLQVTNTLSSTPGGAGAFPCARITDDEDADEPSVGNIDPTGTCFGQTADPAPHGPLADNGGPTRTVALQTGNPAIGAGSPDWCADTDQRDETRDPQLCDAGAYQSGHPSRLVADVTLSGDRYTFIGQDTTFNVSVTAGGTTPTGTLTLLENSAELTDPVAVDQIRDSTSVALHALAQGRHEIVARFTPADGGPDQDSDPVTISFVTLSKVTLTTAAPAALHQPATIIATITDNPDAGGSEPGTPAATGTVTFAVNGEHHDAALTDGSATLHVDQLETATVSIEYTGDDYYNADDNFTANGWSADVTSVDTATTTTADAPAAVEYGQPLHVIATAADAAGPADGTVTLVVDGETQDTQTLTDGQATLTDTPQPGTHTAYVRLTPSAGWAGSQSATLSLIVTPARNSIRLIHDDNDPDAVYPHQPTVGFDADGAGDADVQLKDGGDVVATAHVTLPATGTFALPLGTLNAGQRHLHAEVVPSATAVGASSSELDVTLTPGVAHANAHVDFPGGRVGMPATVHVNTDVPGAVTLTVTDSDGTVVAVAHSPNNQSSFDYTPALWGTTSLTVTATFDDGNWLAAVANVSISADRTSAPSPTMTWHNPGPDFDSAHPYLTVVFPGGPGGLRAPNGLVTLLGPNDENLGQAFLVDGAADIWFLGQPGLCYCGAWNPRLRFSNDGLYEDYTQSAPFADIPARGTTTTLSGVPAGVHLGDQLTLTAHVSARVTIPGGHVEFTVNGQDAGRAELTPLVTDAEAHVTWTVPQNGGGNLDVVARYVPGDITWQPSTSDTQTSTIQFHTAPTVTLEGDGPFTLGQPGHLTLHATQVDQFLDAGAAISVTDDQSNVVGTATWGSHLEGAGAQADITITPIHGGSTVFYAHYSYDNGTFATSEPLTATVEGVYTPLILSTDGVPTVGRPSGVRVTLGPLPAGVHPGLVQVQLYAGTTAVGSPQYLFAVGENRPSAVFFDVPRTKDAEFYTAYTTGDGADLSNGSGSLTVGALGASLHVRANSAQTYTATYGKPATLAPAFGWEPGFGSGPTDGRLLLSLVTADGTVAGRCLTDLPKTQCSLPEWAVPVGTYTIVVSYWGGSVYVDVPEGGPGDGTGGVKVGTLRVTGTQTGLTTGFNTDPLTWVAGDQVTATFQVRDPFNAEQRATGVVVLRSDYGVLCEAYANNQLTAICTFTVPYPSEPLAKQHYSDLVATFTSSTPSMPSTSWNQLGTIARCFTVTGNMTPGVTFVMHAPTVTGSACSTASSSAGRAGTMRGFREGSTVKVTRADDKIGPGYAFTGTEVGFADGTKSVVEPNSGDSKSTVFDVDQNVTVTSAFHWEPSCVDVVAGYETGYGDGMAPADWRANFPGKPVPTYGLQLLRPSNCDLPYGSSDREVEDLKHGIGHYIVGTDVWGNRIKTGVDPAPQKVTWQLVSVSGGTAPTKTEPFWHVTATEQRYSRDQVVYGKFRWGPEMCRPVALDSGTGGTVTVTGSRFPTELSPFEDPSGRCDTTNGVHGYLAGTQVTVTAKPSNAQTTGKAQPDGRDFYLYRWLSRDDLAAENQQFETTYNGQYHFYNYGLGEPTYTSELPGATGHIPGNPYAAQTTVRTMPFEVGAPTWVAASYGVTNCVPVKVDLRWASGDAQVRMPASNCAAIRGDQNVGQTQSNSEKTRTLTRYYTAGTHVDITADATPASTRKLRWSASFRDGRWSWPNYIPDVLADPQAAAARATKDLTFDATASFDVPEDLDGVTVHGGYWNNECTAPDVGGYTKPGYGFHVDPVADCAPGETLGQNYLMAFMPDAARNNHVTAQWKIHTATENLLYNFGHIKYPAAGAQDPIVTSTEDAIGYRDRTYTSGGVTRRSSTIVGLTFCRDLSYNVTTRLVDAAGKPITYRWGDEYTSAPTAASIVRSPGSSCDGLAAEPGYNVALLHLTEEAEKKWNLVAWRNTTTGRLQLVGPSTQIDTKLATLRINALGVPDTNWEAIVTPRCYTLGVGDRVNVNTAPNCVGADPALRMYNPGTVVNLSFHDSDALDFDGWSGATTSNGQSATVKMDQDRGVGANFSETSDFFRGLETRASAVGARVVGFFGTAANALILEPVAAALSVVQKVAVVFSLVASGLEALGVHGSVIDGLHGVSNAIGASIDVLHSLGSCTVGWATGGGSGVLAPSSAAGQAAVTGGTAVAGKVGGAEFAGDLSAGIDLVNLFTANFNAYTQDPAAVWSSMSSIGSCMQQSGETAGRAWSNAGG